MTKIQPGILEKVETLEIEVRVLETKLDNVKDEIHSTKGLLKWFIVLSIAILGAVAQNSVSTIGFRKVVTEQNKTMRELIDQNSVVISDIAIQGMEKGWYKPNYTFREYTPRLTH